MTIDYELKEIYPEWEIDDNGYQITNHEMIHARLVLFNEEICENVNQKFQTEFDPFVEYFLTPKECKEIHRFIVDKRHKYIGIFYSNVHELVEEFKNREDETCS